MGGEEEEDSGTNHIWSSSVVTFIPSTSLWRGGGGGVGGGSGVCVCGRGGS